MQINHNIRAMVTQHSLFQNNNSMTKSLEKLSTGLRINRAQDDAAGLAMSEQMRGQIRGLGKAKQNSQDGQAALQIAEGALGEITNMMQRQKELAVQAANDTLTSTERMYLNDEFQALTKEIDRIAKTTDYNGKNVLLFDMDPNKSFGATKLNPYNQEIVAQEGANVLYKYFGENLQGALSLLSGEGLTTLSGGTAINTAIGAINTEISNAKGVVTIDNIENILQNIVAQSSVAVNGDIKLGGNRIWTGAANADTEYKLLSTDDKKALEDVNAFLKAAQEALADFKAAKVGEVNNRDGADAATISILDAAGDLWRYNDIDNIDFATSTTGISTIDNFVGQLDGLTSAEEVAKVFNSPNGWKAYQVLMQVDTSKLPSGVGEAADDYATTGEELRALQRVVGKLYNDVAKIWNEGSTRIGTSASEILHVTPNYSRGLGGFEASEIKVNYTAIDVRGLGLQAQCIDSQKGATRALDCLDENLKVISSNRAAIGTYINRLEYTVNNIASMEYNTQDAESRIRDTDFSKVTTDFTRNQIMVQSATSMLAQANSLPQGVLGLLG